MEYLKVEGHNNLIRDPNTNSIINTNMSEYQQYLSRRNVKSEENQKIQNLEQDVDNIRNDLDEIKTLLRRLVDGPQ
jgi:tetrahydromethanopterin S-methyltransferase subunit B